ncbi:MAG: Mut7-C ubiquitin/RNAse domain-containing protein [Polyangiaceae bacterium]|nr:Mut7-C ubiquitin/RNAse domain-containing protein [Polyangiaceae bacterium]
MASGHVALRLYGPLNDFLTVARRQKLLFWPLGRPAAVKDVIEAVGVPHPEVGLLLVDGASVGFAHRVGGGERVAAYPTFAAIDVAVLSRVAPPRPAQLRFVVDGHLGRLAAYLRALGLDTDYTNHRADDALARCSSEQERVLLTRDQGLLKRRIVEYGYWVRSTDPEAQLFELCARFDLAGHAAPFTRCVPCNGVLADAQKQDVLERVPPRTRERQEHFRQCTACGQVFWRGSHYYRMRRLIEAVLGRTP